MIVTILSFGPLATHLKSQQMELPSPCTLKELNHILQQKYPAIKRIPYTCAINKTIQSDYNVTLKPGDEVALLPPFSGG